MRSSFQDNRCERKLVCFIAQEVVEHVLSVMKKTRYRQGAVVVGADTNETNGRVLLKTAIGSTDIIDMLAGKCYQGFTEASALTRSSNAALVRALNFVESFLIFVDY